MNTDESMRDGPDYASKEDIRPFEMVPQGDDSNSEEQSDKKD